MYYKKYYLIYLFYGKDNGKKYMAEMLKNVVSGRIIEPINTNYHLKNLNLL